MGFVFGLIMSGMAMLGSVASGEASGWSLIFGVGAVIVLPILYGVMGFIFTLLFAWLYNVCAGWIGGIEIELE